MSKSGRRLGRGLDSLVSNLRTTATLDQETVKTRPLDGDAEIYGPEGTSVEAATLRIDAVNPNPFQPRDITSDDSVLSMARSIKHSGILQPITVRRISGRYQLIAGIRRWRAAKQLGMTHIPVIIREASDEQMLELALIENIQREDLNPIDRARAYRQFCTRFELRPEEVAARLGEDRTTVVNYLRLLELRDSIQRLVAEGKISMGHARCLLGVNDEAQRLRLAESAAQNELSVRALEEIVRREKTRERGGALREVEKTDLRAPHLRDLQQRFEEAIKTKVTIQEGRRKGTGRIVIEYYSLDDFDRIAGALGVTPE